MLGGEPPRRPPHRNPLTRSKSCQGPTRRKRGREVLEDITWIVNHSSSWQQDGATASSRVNDDGVFVDAGRTLEQSMEDEQPVAGPSSARLLAPPFQPPAASATSRSLQAVNMARARSDTSLPSLDPTTPTFNTRLSQINSSSALLTAPRASLSRITILDSSSPPSSPHSASRYGYMGNAATGGGAGGSESTSNRNAGLGLGRAAPLPYLSTSNSTSVSTGSATRRLSGAASPSLRAPPPLRRTSSSSSVSSMDGTSSSTPATSPSLLSAPFASRALARASTVPTFTSPWTDNGAELLNNQQAPAATTMNNTTRVLPIPTIQREMPSPERKRSRHGGRMIEESDDEDADEESDDDE